MEGRAKYNLKVRQSRFYYSKISLWHRNSFELKALKTQEIQENSLLPSQLLKFTLGRGPVPGRELFPEIPFSLRNLSTKQSNICFPNFSAFLSMTFLPFVTSHTPFSQLRTLCRPQLSVCLLGFIVTGLLYIHNYI